MVIYDSFMGLIVLVILWSAAVDFKMFGKIFSVKDIKSDFGKLKIGQY